MRAEYINPFLTAIGNVLNEVVPGITFERGQLNVSNNPITAKGCASLIGVTGSVDGRVILDMTRETAIKIASIMNQESFAQFDQMVSSTINELTNIICGSAMTLMSQNGLHLDISAPTIFTGTDMCLYDSKSLGSAVIIPIQTNYGELFLNVAMQEKSA